MRRNLRTRGWVRDINFPKTTKRMPRKPTSAGQACARCVCSDPTHHWWPGGDLFTAFAASRPASREVVGAYGTSPVWIPDNPSWH